MRTLALTILTMVIVLAARDARAGPDSYCLQGRQWVIPAIVNSPATPSAWRLPAVLTPIAASIRRPRSRASGVAPIGTIGTDTERRPIGSAANTPSSYDCCGA